MTIPVNEEKLHAFVDRMLGDLGAAASLPLVRIGDSLGLYRTLHAEGPMTSAELAAAAGCGERYVREWLAHQAASGYVEYRAAEGRFALSPEQAMVFAEEDSPVFMMGAFDLAASLVRDEPAVRDAFRTGAGVPYKEREGCLFCAMARFFHTGYRTELVPHWLPALDSVVPRLEAGARVADVGCGYGLTTVMMAEAFPASTFVGYDFHPASIAAARRHMEGHGLCSRVRFEVAGAADYDGAAFDLITIFDALHDLGDPVAAVRHAREKLAPDGTLMVVEPFAADRLEDNLNPVGRLFYGGSTMICVPASLAQEGQAALGAQAGPSRLAAVLAEGGFSRVRRAAETPFHLVLEAKV